MGNKLTGNMGTSGTGQSVIADFLFCLMELQETFKDTPKK